MPTWALVCVCVCVCVWRMVVSRSAVGGCVEVLVVGAWVGVNVGAYIIPIQVPTTLTIIRRRNLDRIESFVLLVEERWRKWDSFFSSCRCLQPWSWSMLYCTGKCAMTGFLVLSRFDESSPKTRISNNSQTMFNDLVVRASEQQHVSRERNTVMYEHLDYCSTTRDWSSHHHTPDMPILYVVLGVQ